MTEVAHHKPNKGNNIHSITPFTKCLDTINKHKVMIILSLSSVKILEITWEDFPKRGIGTLF